MIGLSSTYYAIKGLTVYESVRKIAELGFELIELGAAHKFEENIWETLKQLRREFPRLKFTVHGLFPPLKEMVWFNAAEGLSEINVEIVDNLFNAAEVLRAVLITIHPPIANDVGFLGNKVPGGFFGASSGREKDRQLSWRRFLELMAYIDAKAQRAGTMVGIENMNIFEFNAMISSARKFSEVFDRFPRTGLLFDVGHALLSDQVSEYGVLREKIVELHLHDVRDVEDKGKWGHFAIEDKKFFDSAGHFLLKENTPIVFEHGEDVSEDEILEEKRLLERFICNRQKKERLATK